MTYAAPKTIILKSSKVCNVVKRQSKTWFKQTLCVPPYLTEKKKP